jgi:hypothetical protein
MFHDHCGATFGTSTLALRVIACRRISNVIIDKRSDDGAWEGTAYYEFEIVE